METTMVASENTSTPTLTAETAKPTSMETTTMTSEKTSRPTSTAETTNPTPIATSMLKSESTTIPTSTAGPMVPCTLPCTNGICVIIPTSRLPKCKCNDGFVADASESTCIDKNECQLDSQACDQACRNTIGAYQCGCGDGYQLDDSNNRTCNRIDFCRGSPCNNGGTCSSTLYGFVCTCTGGWEGKTCEKDVDECKTDNQCSRHSTCKNTPGSFTCNCNAGWTGSTCSEDIDECLSSPCANGKCKNIPGSYSCQCSPGWTGLNCDSDINECLSQPCRNDATCKDLKNDFSCSCKPGYTGRFCEIDIDDCKGVVCAHGGICIDGINNYTCRCTPNWQGLLCDIDVNECTIGLSRCDSNAVCTNIVGSYNCSCNAGYKGDGLSCREIRLFDYSSDWRATQLKQDFSSQIISIPIGFPFDSNFYSSLYFTDNGVIVFQRNRYEPIYTFRNPYSFFKTDFYTPPMIAAFWADADFSAGDGQLYYRVFEFQRNPSTDDFKSRLEASISTYFKALGIQFSALWAIRITWEQVPPYPAKDFPRGQGPSTNTYQAVLATDGIYSFCLILFEDGGMNWRYEALPTFYTPKMGYFSGQPRTSSSITFPAYNDPQTYGSIQQAYRPDRYTGALTGKNGTFVYRLENNNNSTKNPRKNCLNWYFNEPPPYWSFNTAPCPCTLQQALFDPNFVPEDLLTYYGFQINNPGYYYTVQSMSPGWYGAGSRCYYNSFNGPILFGIKERYLPTPWMYGPWQWAWYSGWYDKKFKEIRTNYQEIEINPYNACCADFSSFDLCPLYYEKRPPDFCYGYIPPRRGFFFGDPHIYTLDGLTYTFNGLGEFILANVRNENDTVVFRLQGRTARAGNGTSHATNFVGLAAQISNGSKVQWGIRDENITTVMVNGSFLSITNATYFEKVLLGVTEQNEIRASFDGGISVTVSASLGALTFVTSFDNSYQNRTEGLLGVFNGDGTDDLMAANGTRIQFDGTKLPNESLIFEMGMTWKTTPANSLFDYNEGESWFTYNNNSFVPTFYDELLLSTNSSLIQKANETCQGNDECIFDILSTGSFAFGKTTLQGSEIFTQQQKTIENFPPNITGPSELHAALNEIAVVYYTATDQDDDPVVFTVVTNSTDVTITKNGTLIWKPTSSDPAYVTIRANDSKITQDKALTLILCNCTNNATCNYNVTTVSDEKSAQFQTAECGCTEAYTGRYCTDDYDACQIESCYVSNSCNDTRAPGVGYTCGPCPLGLIGDGLKCADYDECTQNKSNCQQNCINIFGGFNCSCWEGYRVNSVNSWQCDDINECEENNPCASTAICTNTLGGYSCDCPAGFRGNATLVCTDIDECADTNSTICPTNSVCNNTIGSYKCDCFVGYNGTNCTDIDECASSSTTCPITSECINNMGSFTCQCKDGYDGEECKDIDECATNQDNCHTYAYCNNTDGSFSCRCWPGFTGNGTDCQDINECTVNASSCQVNEDCKNIRGGFECPCKAGYSSVNGTCQDIDECAVGQYCTGMAEECQNTPGNYSCRCIAGYVNVNSVCQDIDECSNDTLNNCSKGKGICSNIGGSYRCSCKPGFQGDGVNCTDINECYSDTLNTCSKTFGICSNVEGSYICICKPGFQGDGVHCADIDECSNDTLNNCSKGNGICSNIGGSYRCSCKPGFQGDGVNCTDIDECALGHYCTGMAEECQNTPGNYSCRCIAGYVNVNSVCQDIDECSNDTLNNCSKGKGICSNIGGSYSCSCKPGFQGDGVNCTDINECSSDTLNTCSKTFGICSNVEGSYLCICKPGFQGDGVHCADIDECSNDTLNNCSKGNGICSNIGGSYHCSCKPGFQGDGVNCIALITTTQVFTDETTHSAIVTTDLAVGTGNATEGIPTITTSVTSALFKGSESSTAVGSTASTSSTQVTKAVSTEKSTMYTAAVPVATGSTLHTTTSSLSIPSDQTNMTPSTVGQVTFAKSTEQTNLTSEAIVTSTVSRTSSSTITESSRATHEATSAPITTQVVTDEATHSAIVTTDLAVGTGNATEGIPTITTSDTSAMFKGSESSTAVASTAITYSTQVTKAVSTEKSTMSTAAVPVATGSTLHTTTSSLSIPSDQTNMAPSTVGQVTFAKSTEQTNLPSEAIVTRTVSRTSSSTITESSRATHDATSALITTQVVTDETTHSAIVTTDLAVGTGNATEGIPTITTSDTSALFKVSESSTAVASTASTSSTQVTKAVSTEKSTKSTAAVPIATGSTLHPTMSSLSSTTPSTVVQATSAKSTEQTNLTSEAIVTRTVSRTSTATITESSRSTHDATSALITTTHVVTDKTTHSATVHTDVAVGTGNATEGIPTITTSDTSALFKGSDSSTAVASTGSTSSTQVTKAVSTEKSTKSTAAVPIATGPTLHPTTSSFSIPSDQTSTAPSTVAQVTFSNSTEQTNLTLESIVTSTVSRTLSATITESSRATHDATSALITTTHVVTDKTTHSATVHTDVAVGTGNATEGIPTITTSDTSAMFKGSENSTAVASTGSTSSTQVTKAVSTEKSTKSTAAVPIATGSTLHPTTSSFSIPSDQTSTAPSTVEQVTFSNSTEQTNLTSEAIVTSTVSRTLSATITESSRATHDATSALITTAQVDTDKTTHSATVSTHVAAGTENATEGIPTITKSDTSELFKGSESSKAVASTASTSSTQVTKAVSTEKSNKSTEAVPVATGPTPYPTTSSLSIPTDQTSTGPSTVVQVTSAKSTEQTNLTSEAIAISTVSTISSATITESSRATHDATSGLIATTQVMIDITTNSTTANPVVAPGTKNPTKGVTNITSDTSPLSNGIEASTTVTPATIIPSQNTNVKATNPTTGLDIVTEGALTPLANATSTEKSNETSGILTVVTHTTRDSIIGTSNTEATNESSATTNTTLFQFSNSVSTSPASEFSIMGTEATSRSPSSMDITRMATNTLENVTETTASTFTSAAQTITEPISVLNKTQYSTTPTTFASTGLNLLPASTTKVTITEVSVTNAFPGTSQDRTSTATHNTASTNKTTKNVTPVMTSVPIAVHTAVSTTLSTMTNLTSGTSVSQISLTSTKMASATITSIGNSTNFQTEGIHGNITTTAKFSIATPAIQTLLTSYPSVNRTPITVSNAVTIKTTEQTISTSAVIATSTISNITTKKTTTKLSTTRNGTNGLIATTQVMIDITTNSTTAIPDVAPGTKNPTKGVTNITSDTSPLSNGIEASTTVTPATGIASQNTNVKATNPTTRLDIVTEAALTPLANATSTEKSNETSGVLTVVTHTTRDSIIGTSNTEATNESSATTHTTLFQFSNSMSTSPASEFSIMGTEATSRSPSSMDITQMATNTLENLTETAASTFTSAAQTITEPISVLNTTQYSTTPTTFASTGTNLPPASTTEVTITEQVSVTNAFPGTSQDRTSTATHNTASTNKTTKNVTPVMTSVPIAVHTAVSTTLSTMTNLTSRTSASQISLTSTKMASATITSTGNSTNFQTEGIHGNTTTTAKFSIATPAIQTILTSYPSGNRTLITVSNAITIKTTEQTISTSAVIATSTISTITTKKTTTKLSTTHNGTSAVHLYSYGLGAGDTEFVQRTPNFNSRLFKPDIGFPFGRQLYTSLYFTDNGQIIFPPSDNDVFSYVNPPPGGFTESNSVPMVAVFWDNADFSKNVGSTFYQEYTTLNSVTNTLVQDVEAKIQKYMRTSYTAKWTLKVTWDNAPAFPAKDKDVKTNTYQAVLTTDGITSYVLILFKDGGMNWDVASLATTNVLIGYSSGQTDGFFKNDDLTKLSPAEKYRPSDRVGFNTDLRGLWIYKLDNNIATVNYRLKCLEWYNTQEAPTSWNSNLLMCPCSLQQGRLDFRFRSTKAGLSNTEEMLRSILPNNYSSGVRCSYTPKGLLIAGYQERVWIFSRNASVDDVELQPFDWCCKKLDNPRFCDRYIEKRPRIGCTGYVPLFPAWMYGDPHITTLDAHGYTFNGLGDFTLLNATGTGSSFILQGRTTQTGTALATNFNAFASQYSSGGKQIQVEWFLQNDTLQVALNKNIVTFVYSEDMDANIYNDTGIFLIKGNNSVSATFDGVVAVSVLSSLGILSAVSSLPTQYINRTSGLLGVWNSDTADDFSMPNGTTIAIRSSESDIYNYGMTWQVGGPSLFSFAVPTILQRNSTFTPLFLGDLMRANASGYGAASSVCGGNIECIYDTLSTGSSAIGAQTQRLATTFGEANLTLNSYPPVITGNASVATYKRERVQVTYSASGTGVKFTPYTSPDLNFTENGTLLWSPSSMAPVTLQIVATSSNNLAALFQPIFILCFCALKDQCDNSVTEQINGSSLHVSACVCKNNYSGAYCDVPPDPCVQGCFPGVNCTTSSGCGPCPPGLTGYGVNCADADECSMVKPCSLYATCINTVGSYSCTCKPGFNGNGTYCADKDECQNNRCHQDATCTNTVGSYTCTCNPGFQGNGTYCADKDECLNNQCHQDATCTNTVGSYTCTCNAGFQGNGKSCCPSLCLPHYCRNGGTCTRSLSDCGQTCTCAPGYQGPTCGSASDSFGPVAIRDLPKRTVHLGLESTSPFNSSDADAKVRELVANLTMKITFNKNTNYSRKSQSSNNQMNLTSEFNYTGILAEIDFLNQQLVPDLEGMKPRARSVTSNISLTYVESGDFTRKDVLLTYFDCAGFPDSLYTLNPNTFMCESTCKGYCKNNAACNLTQTGPVCTCVPFSIYTTSGLTCDTIAMNLNAFFGILFGALAFLLLLMIAIALIVYWYRKRRMEVDDESFLETDFYNRGYNKILFGFKKLQETGVPCASNANDTPTLVGWKAHLENVDTSMKAKIARPQVLSESLSTETGNSVE
ncbi:uncharacterized protein LOC144792796 [Lissotriton helveticus]